MDATPITLDTRFACSPAAAPSPPPRMRIRRKRNPRRPRFLKPAFTLMCLCAAPALFAACDRDRARSERITIVDAGGYTGVQSTPNETPEQSVIERAGEVTVIGSDKKADNTGVNARDRGKTTLTAGEQAMNEGDRTITQKVRQGVMKDGSLSMTAKNVKIITIDGVVTLRGPVKSESERAAIEAAAKIVPNVKQVDNQLEVISKP